MPWYPFPEGFKSHCTICCRCCASGRFPYVWKLTAAGITGPELDGLNRRYYLVPGGPGIGGGGGDDSVCDSFSNQFAFESDSTNYWFLRHLSAPCGPTVLPPALLSGELDYGGEGHSNAGPSYRITGDTCTGPITAILTNLNDAFTAPLTVTINLIQTVACRRPLRSFIGVPFPNVGDALFYEADTDDWFGYQQLSNPASGADWVHRIKRELGKFTLTITGGIDNYIDFGPGVPLVSYDIDEDDWDYEAANTLTIASGPQPPYPNTCTVAPT